MVPTGSHACVRERKNERLGKEIKRSGKRKRINIIKMIMYGHIFFSFMNAILSEMEIE